MECITLKFVITSPAYCDALNFAWRNWVPLREAGTELARSPDPRSGWFVKERTPAVNRPWDHSQFFFGRCRNGERVIVLEFSGTT
jgi:hypothetical protein